MAEAAPGTRRGRKQRRANRGSFAPGPDPRRHKFTRQDCWLGYAVCFIRHPHLREWLKTKIRVYYWQKGARRGAQAISGHATGGDPAVAGDRRDDDFDCPW